MTGGWWRSVVGAVGVIVAAVSPGRATATLTCDIDSREATFHVMAAVGHEALTLSGVRGALRLPQERIDVDLDGEQLLQTWVEGEDLRLRFHIFGEGGRPDIDLMIVTRRKGEIAYAGRYRLTIGEGTGARHRRGTIGCAVG